MKLLTPLRRGVKQGGTSTYRTLGATVVAFAPGFCVPFLVPFRLEQADAAVFFLGYAVSMVVINTIGNAVETASIGASTLAIAKADRLSIRSFNRAVRDIFVVSAVGCLIVFPLGVVIFSVGDVALNELILTLVVLSLYPVIYALSCVFSGYVIAIGAVAYAISSQAARALPALGLLVFMDSVSIVILAASFSIGELMRAAALLGKTFAQSSGASVGAGRETSLALDVRGVLWQAGSLFAGQGVPVINRVFLLPFGPAALVAYELSERMFGALNQFVTTGIVLRRLPQWSKSLLTLSPEVRHQVSSDIRRTVGVAAVLGLLSGGVVLCGFISGLIPEQWSQGALWYTLSAIGLAAAVGTAALSRVIVLVHRQRALVWVVGTSIICSVALNWLFVSLLGAAGVVLAMVLARYGQLVVSWRVGLKPSLYGGSSPRGRSGVSS